MRIALPKAVAEIYRAVAELENEFPGRKFTPDGHLVGSIGEVIAAKALGLRLHPASFAGHDAEDDHGRNVQIKLTGGKCVSMYSNCDRLVVMRIVSPDEAEVVYDGDGDPAWLAAGKQQKNGQRPIRLSALRRIAETSALKVHPQI